MRAQLRETVEQQDEKVLERLLQLDHEHYEKEVRQRLHKKDKKKSKEEQPTRQ